MISLEEQKVQVEIDKLQLETERLRAINDLDAEKLRMENAKAIKMFRWYEVVLIVAGLFAIGSILPILQLLFR